MIDFTKLPKGDAPTCTFFAASMRAAVVHFLDQQEIAGWDIISKADAKDLLQAEPAGPVRLTDSSPREERAVLCLVSYFDPAAAASLIRQIPDSREYCLWTKERSEKEQREIRRREAWAKEPSPLSVLRSTADAADT